MKYVGNEIIKPSLIFFFKVQRRKLVNIFLKLNYNYKLSFLYLSDSNQEMDKEFYAFRQFQIDAS